MTRIALADHRNANARQRPLLDAAQAQLGSLPTHLKVLANSPAALKAFVGLQGVSRKGSLSLQTRERMALAQHNGSDYCLAAHAALGREAGLTGDGMAANRAGSSEDAKAGQIEFDLPHADPGGL